MSQDPWRARRERPYPDIRNALVAHEDARRTELAGRARPGQARLQQALKR